MLSIDELVAHLNKKGIKTEPNQVQYLKNIGYYPGYKEYRYIRKQEEKIEFLDFNDIMILNKFDMELKTLFYPKIMFIETAFKNYVVESILDYNKSEDLEKFFNKCIINYNSYTHGSKNYNNYKNKISELKHKIKYRQINSDPIYKIIHILTLGEFGTLFSCLNEKIKQKVSKLLTFPSNYDENGNVTKFIIYTIKDLRNAVAHNNIIFDTRFKTSNINDRIKKILKHEMDIYVIDFNYIYEYAVLIVYILHKFNQPGEELIDFLNNFINSTDIIKNFPQNIHDKILGTNMNSSIRTLKHFIRKH